jgi:hypothetical protein
MVKIQFSILNKKWTLRILKRKKYDRKNGADSVAVTKSHKRQIDLGPDGRDLETIIHELVHGFTYELCIHSANLDVDSLEEIFAELMAKHGKDLLDLADKLKIEVDRAIGEVL